MASEKTAAVIRLIKLILDVVWFGTIGAMVLVAAIWIVLSGSMHLPWYTVIVDIEPSALHFDMTRAADGQSVVFQRPGEPDESFEEATGELRIKSPSLLFAIMYNITAALKAAFTLAVIYLLRRLFTALKDESPFTRANAMRVRAIGLFIFLGYFAYSFLQMALRYYTAGLVKSHGLTVQTGYHPNFQMLFLGLVLIAIAELFRHGVALEEDRALTI